MRVLIVLTSHDTLGTSGNKTGFWLAKHQFKQKELTSWD